MKAIWNDTLIAESANTVIIEGNHYFPLDSVNRQYLMASNKTSHCPWKGIAHYYSLHVDGKENCDAVWYYPDPHNAAKEIQGRLAFWRGVEVVE